jgi:hypothetical protein
MKKFFNLQLIIVFTCFSIASLHAQDSVKKAKTVKPATVKPNPLLKYKTYKHPAGYYKSKYHIKKAGDTALKAPTYAKVPDTSKIVAKPDIITDKSLNGQYQYLLTKVYNYQQPLVGAFHKSMMDTLIQARHALKDAQAKLAIQTKTIDSLQANVKASDATLTQSNAKVNEVSLLGISLTKTAYNLIMWGLVIIFGAAAVIVIGRSGAYSREAKYRVQLYNELDEEFKTYKAKANEKEKKLARELQTERNKLDDMLGK